MAHVDPRQVGPHVLQAFTAQLDHLAVGQDHRQPEDVVRGHAVLEAVRPARVEGDVAADRADLLARGIGRVVEPVPGRRLGDRGVDRPRLHHGDPLGRVQPEDPVQPVERNDQAAGDRHRAAGEAGPAPAGHEGHAMLVAQPHRRDHLVAGLRDHHRQGLDAERRQAVGLERRQPGLSAEQPRGWENAAEGVEKGCGGGQGGGAAQPSCSHPASQP